MASSYFIIAALAGIGVPCLASLWSELLVFIAAFNRLGRYSRRYAQA